MLKKLSFILVTFLIITKVVIAGVPYLINYRGNLIESGSPVNGTKTINFQIYDMPTGGAPLWESGSKSIDILNGAVAYTFGLDNASAFSNIDWKNKEIYLQVIVEGNPLTPRERLGSVGYAIVAQEAVFVESTNVDLGSGYRLSDWVTNSGMMKGSKVQGGTTPGNHGSTHASTGGDPLQANSLTSNEIADGSVISADIKDGTIKNIDLASDTDSLSKVSGGVMVVSNGNVGIGTTSPLAPLHIYNTVNQPSAIFEGTTGSAPSIRLKHSGLGGREYKLGPHTDAGFFQIMDLTVGMYRFTISSNGNVGIGTASPSADLDVKAKSGIDAEIEIDSGAINRRARLTLFNPASSSAGSGNEIVFKEGDGDGSAGDSYFDIHHSPQDGRLVLRTKDSGGSFVNVMSVLEGTTNVGIGTTSPTSKLHVIGDIHCTGKLTSDGGNDPPYVLYNYENRESIIERVKKEVPEDKLNGAVLFYNGQEMQLEVYLPAKGEFRNLAGSILAKVDK